MRKLVASFLAVAALGTSSPAFAQAECVPEFVQTGQTVTLSNITVGRGQVANKTFQVAIRNAGDGNARCPARLRIARLSTSPTFGEFEYQIKARGRDLRILPNESVPANASSDLEITQLPGLTQGLNVPFRVVVPSNWGLSSGSQVDDLIVSLIDRAGNTTDTLRLTVALNVPPAVEVRTVGATGRNAIASVDLGVLDPDQVNVSNPFGIRVWSTSPYTVTFQSMNDGRLVHSSAASSIAYQLFMNRNEVSTRGVPAAYVPNGTDALGDLHRLRVQVRPFRARAGDYSDRVEVTVTAS